MESNSPLHDVDLTGIQKELLCELFIGGANTPKNLEDHISTDRVYASRLLKDLEEQDLVHNKGGGVYDLSFDGMRSARGLIADLRMQGDGPDVRSWFGDR